MADIDGPTLSPMARDMLNSGEATSVDTSDGYTVTRTDHAESDAEPETPEDDGMMSFYTDPVHPPKGQFGGGE